MAGKGGARPGAGRKPKAERYESQIRKAEKRVADHLPRLIENLIQLADGVMTEEVNILTGTRGVYTHPPDLRANQYLIDRIMGKPIDRKEFSGPDQGPIPLDVSPIDYRSGLRTLAPPKSEEGVYNQSCAPMLAR